MNKNRYMSFSMEFKDVVNFLTRFTHISQLNQYTQQPQKIY